MTRILLINPPVTTTRNETIGPNPPLGLAYIAAYLEQENYKVSILDALAEGIENPITKNDFVRFGLSDDDIERFISSYEPDVVGISQMFTSYSNNAHEIAKIVKQTCPDTLVVHGGAHPSSAPHIVLDDDNVDLVVQGEGERTFLEIIHEFENDGSFQDVPGVWMKKRNEVIFTQKRPYFQDIDEIPFPARHLLPMEKYFEANRKGVNYAMRLPYTTMITSRGCPYDCVFCSIHSIWGYKWRPRLPSKVVDEIEFLQKSYGIREIHFLDDNVTLDRTRMEKICDEIIRREIDIKWTTPNGVAIWTLNKPLIQRMKTSGCYRLTFGLESGNENTLNFIGKRYDRNHALDIIDYCNKIGLYTLSTFIIGFPYEPLQSIEDTIDYAINSGIDWAIFYIATPLPFTRMYDIYINEGYYRPEEGNHPTEFGGGCSTQYFNSEELIQLQNLAHKKFLNNRFLSYPYRFVQKIKSLEDFKYGIKLLKIITTSVNNSRKGPSTWWNTA